MEKFMQAINKAKGLDIPMLHRFEHEGIVKMFLENSPEGKRRRERELAYLKNAYTEAIMNSRDTRVRMQRDLTKLTDIEIWEPESLTDEEREIMQDLRESIAYCRQNEAEYFKAREELM